MPSTGVVAAVAVAVQAVDSPVAMQAAVFPAVVMHHFPAVPVDFQAVAGRRSAAVPVVFRVAAAHLAAVPAVSTGAVPWWLRSAAITAVPALTEGPQAVLLAELQ